MIQSKFIRCNDCSSKYRIRYNVGNKFPQSASFYCLSCGSEITYGYNQDHKVQIDNAVEIQEPDDSTVINLHPELPIDPSKVSDPKYFPSLEYMKDNVDISNLYQFRKVQASAIEYLNYWRDIKKDFRLLREERWKLLETKYGTDENEIKKNILSKLVEVAKIFLEGKWDDILVDFQVELDKAKTNSGYNDMKIFLENFKDEFLLHKLFDLMNQYESVETELLSTLLSQKQGIKPKGLAAYTNWNKIERIYGDFYEIYGELLIIPTCINNIIERNNYEFFATNNFTISKYRLTDKAGRTKNFLANTMLKPLADFYNPSLRNGTHHKTARINKGKQKIVIKTGKGGANDETFSFIEYIELSNEIYARCLIILIIYFRIIYEN